jgi:hypothetical protein
MPGELLAVFGMMSDFPEAIDYTPGPLPEVRKVGTTVLVVLPIRDASPEYPNVRLVLRFEANGDLFAAIAGGAAQSS